MKKDIIEQLDLLVLQLGVARLFIVEAQQKSLGRPCRMEPKVCLMCRIKRKILKERKSKS